MALLFAMLSVITEVTDMPGYYYAPTAFALVNLVVVPVVGSLLLRHPAHCDDDTNSRDGGAGDAELR